MQKYN